MTTENSENAKLLPIRFSTKADKLLRKGNIRRGDLTRRVIEAVEGVDLGLVSVEERRKTPGAAGSYEATTIKLPQPLYDEIKKVATARGTSMSALIDGCVREHFAPQSRSPGAR